MEDLSAFEKDIADGTTPAKSLQDAAKDVIEAQKAVVETETELQKLRKDTDTRKQNLREVMGQCAWRCFTNLRVNLPFTHPHRKYAKKLFYSTLDNSR